METETLLAISAGATFLLALAAFWAIWQTYSFRKETKELSIKIQKIDRIISWAYEVRQVILTLMDEWVKYLQEQGHYLAMLNVNLEAQLTNREAQKKATDSQELTNLKRELRELKREEAEVELKNKYISEHGYLFIKMLPIIGTTSAEYEVLEPIADEFGKDFRDLFEKSGKSLERVIKWQESIKDLHGETELRKQIEILGKDLELINFLCSSANSIKSLLLRYGSELKL